MGFLIIVLLVAATSPLWAAVTTSFAAVFAFNFFFLPPIGTLTIADPQNWIALFSLLVVSLVASNLSAVARARTRDAVARRDELARLFDLSRDVLLIAGGEGANDAIAGFIASRFGLEGVAICMPQGAGWSIAAAGPRPPVLDPRELSAIFHRAGEPPRTDGGASTTSITAIRLAERPIGVLGAAGGSIERQALEAIAGLAALAIERAQFLDDRKAADVARQSEALKSALLASLGHDLRTPLTAIRVAASNLQATWPDERERQTQSDVILTEVDRLTRMFQNILEMARIDAGAVAEDKRWVPPAEIIEAARGTVEHALRGRTIDVAVESDRLVRLDPRLTAAALSHLLENAAHYAAAPSPIHVRASVSDGGLAISVRDHGPGIPPADLPHVFERFYRGAGAKGRRSGTGMGLAIASGMLAVEQGRVFAENVPGGGACFTIDVPAEVK